VRARKESGTATSIIWVIDEGSRVKKGEVIARLDDAHLREQLDELKLKAGVAGQALAKATENMRLVERSGAIEVRLAEIGVKLAELELKEAAPGKSKDALELQLERAKLLHERAQARAKAEMKQAEAEKRAHEAARELENERLEEIRGQLEHCRVLAPRDGYVVYPTQPTGRFGSTIAAGEAVREGQRLLRVTPLERFAFVVLVPEAQIAMVRTGQQAEVSVDALPDKRLRGKVARVSNLAEPNYGFRTDTKKYSVTVAIDEPPPGLKPALTGVANVSIGERKNALLVPRKAVAEVEGDAVCFVRTDRGLEERGVVLGAGNASVVEIGGGLREGDEVLAELIPSRAGKK
jgi:RND family efflux transporter MFP subunit